MGLSKFVKQKAKKGNPFAKGSDTSTKKIASTVSNKGGAGASSSSSGGSSSSSSSSTDTSSTVDVGKSTNPLMKWAKKTSKKG